MATQQPVTQQILSSLAIDFGPLAAIASAGDPDGVWQSAVTQAYGEMGVDLTAPIQISTATLTAQQAADAPWLAEYYALRTLVRWLAVRSDVVTGKQQEKRSQAFTQAQALLAEALAAVQARGYAVEQAFSVGRIELDFLEPVWTAQ